MKTDGEQFKKIYLDIINEENNVVDESLGKNLATAALVRFNTVD